MKFAVVTGASKGIGEAVTRRLLKTGYKVYGVARSLPPVEHPNFVWIQCDLSVPHQIPAALSQIGTLSLDVVVSNAGVAYSEPATQVTVESYHRTFSVNVLAPMLIMNALTDKIRQATIVSVSSDSDRFPDADLALYCSSKAANTLYFDSLAKALPEANVYTLLPDYVDTPMLRNLESAEFDWNQTLQPKDIAQLVDDLAAKRLQPESGANIIVVTESMKGALQTAEKL